MLFSDGHILSTILFTPLVGAVLTLFIPRRFASAHRLMGNLFGLLGLAVSLPLTWRFNFNESDFQFRQVLDWIPSINAHYSLGIDGISFLMVMLTTILGAIAILSSWSAIHKREKEYYILLLLLQTGMLGVFMSLDFVLFYVFWEVMLVPMYFLIGVWGSDRRLYAAIKFFLYTLAGSGGMLLGLFLCFRDQSAHVPVSHLAAGCAHRSADGGIGHSGGRAAKNGDLRVYQVLAAHVSSGGGAVPRDCDRALTDRNYLRRAGLHDAEGYEEAHRLFVSEPHGILHSGAFRAHPIGPFRERDPADQSRNFDGRAVLDCGRPV